MNTLGIEEIVSSGHLEIGEISLYCFVTKTGKRLITASDVFRAVGRTRRGESRVEGYPPFIGARNIVPFIDDDFRGLMQPVKYRATNGKISEAYDATVIPRVADLYIEAHDRGVLSQAQEAVYERSLVIIRSLAKVGIAALVDEATGYQYNREAQALQKLLSAYISEDLLKWQAHFPREFYEEIYRLYGISDKFDPMNTKHPQWIGSFTNKYVYGVFPNEVMDEIRKRNPLKMSAKKVVYRGHKHFQHLTESVGLPQLDKHLSKLIGVMMLSNNMNDFNTNFVKVFANELERKSVQDDIKNGLVPLIFD